MYMAVVLPITFSVVFFCTLPHVSVYCMQFLLSPFPLSPFTCLYLPQHVNTPSTSHVTNHSTADIHLEGPFPVSV